MKNLIVISNPNPNSFSYSILNTVIEESKIKGNEIEVRDLYKIGFDPVLKISDFESLTTGNLPADIKTEQDFIRWAELITFIYPIWWVGLPAILKGYIDRVFLNGFAFKYTETGVEGLLKGKKAVLFNNQGTPIEYYEASGMKKALEKTSDDGILRFSGIEVISHTFFDKVPMAGNSQKEEFLKKVTEVISQL